MRLSIFLSNAMVLVSFTNPQPESTSAMVVQLIARSRSHTQNRFSGPQTAAGSQQLPPSGELPLRFLRIRGPVVQLPPLTLPSPIGSRLDLAPA